MLTSGLGRSSTTGGAVITAAKTLETHRIASRIRDGQFECRLYLPSNPPQCTALLPSPERKSQCSSLTQRNTKRTVINSAIRLATWTASRDREIWPWLPPQFRARNYRLGEGSVEETYRVLSYLPSPERVTRPLQWND
jgi:hypothetical protein